jgi:hydrogenase nickel incorporation protein HypB
MPPRILEVRQAVLAKNDVLARRLREAFTAAGVCIISVVSGPGSGKTTLLCETLRRLADRYRVAALVGDLATDHDAVRLRSSGAPVRQITTGTVCHLDAAMVERALAGWDLAALDYLFIENVGNLVCPASYDLGEHRRVVLLSVTEGEDKPQKYPPIFTTADLAVVTKIDLAAAVGYDHTLMRRALSECRPGLPVLQVSARTGSGMREWIGWLDAVFLGVRSPRAPSGGGVRARA